MRWRRNILPAALLQAGRTPAYFRRVLARSVQRLGALQRQSSWISAIDAVDLRLDSEPLLGRTLAGLFDQSTPPAGKRAPVTRTQARDSGISAPQRQPQQSAARPRPPLDTRDLLRASEPVLSATTPAPATGKPADRVPTAATERATQPESAQPTGKAPAPGGADPHSEVAERQLRAVLALPARAALPLLHALAHAGGVQAPRVATTETGAGSPLRDVRPTGADTHNGRRAAPELPAAEAIPAELVRQATEALQSVRGSTFMPQASTTLRERLAIQLALPIGGTRAPADLIYQLATGQSKLRVSNADRAALVSAATLEQHHDGAALADPAWSGGLPKAGTPGAPVDTAAARRDGPRPTSIAQPETPSSSSVGDVASGRPLPDSRPAAVTEATTAPPAVAPQLPPLLPPQRPGLPALSLAAAGARQGARAEAMEELDLDALADSIKRILDEQARRHGIDV